MAITISGENNNDKILASDGVIDSLSGFNIVGVITATSFTGDLTGDVTGNLIGNVTGNINNSTLLLQTGGTERVRITSGGQVGIATDNPNGQFHIHQSSAGSVTAATDANDLVIESSTNVGMSLLTANNSLARIKFGDPDETGAGVIVYNHQNDKFSIVTDTNNRMIIGSDMISARTHYGVARTAGGYTFRETNEGSERAGMHSDASNNLIFKTGAASEKVRITSSGLVGIGTVAPSKTLHVYKNNQHPLMLERGDNANTQIELRTSGATRGYWGCSGTANFMVYDNDASDIQFVVNQTGKVGIDATDPQVLLDVGGSSSGGLNGLTNSVLYAGYTNNTNFGGVVLGAGANGNSPFIAASKKSNGTALSLDLITSGSKRLRIASNGRLLYGNQINDRGAELQYEGDQHACIGIHRNTANHGAPAFVFSASRGTSAGSNTIVQNNDYLGLIRFAGTDGVNLASGVEITARVDGTPGENDMPGRLSFWTSPDGSQTPVERLRIDSSGRTSVGRNLSSYVASAMSSAANDFIITTGAGSNGGMSIVNSGADIGNIFFAHGTSENSIGRIQYDHNGDDFIFTAGGNPRGRIYNNAGVTGIEHHQFHPFLIGYDVQNATSITMSRGFGGMSQLPMNADGDKAYMSYVTHWRHREYAGVYFWYGASGNTSGATFDWDFTVWNASSGGGYSSSSHTFTVTSGTMSNGKMYRLNALSSWPTHGVSKFVQFEIEFDELQNGTSLQLSGMELVEYTTP